MDRKGKIILATLELASAKGLKAVSMSQIAEKVGIKAPSLYNHFRSKDEIIKAMYGFLREKAQKKPSPVFAEQNDSKSLQEILTEAVSAYQGMIEDQNMTQFFRVLYSERSLSPLGAEIMVEETEHMIQATKNLFYGLAVHGKMKSEDVDTAALTFALTVHALIDYRMDRITAGVSDPSGNDESLCTKQMMDFIRWFSMQAGGENHEQKAH